MRTPLGMMGAALALWGFSIDAPVVGILLGLALEGTRFLPYSAAASSRLVLVIRIVVLVALAKLAYSAVASPFPQALYTWLRWLPVILLPLPMLQAVAGGSIPNAAVERAMLRHARRDGNPDGAPAYAEVTSIDITYAYVAVTLIAAGTGSAVERWFYIAAAGIVAWALAARVQRKARFAGVAMISAAVGIGFGVHVGLSALQGNVEEWGTEMLQDYFAAKADAFRERTRIGDLGRIKLSDRILMRVVPEGEGPRPASLLLREAAFDRYYNGEWQTGQRAFKPVPRDGDRWKLREASAKKALTVRRSISGGEGLIALPVGSSRVERLPADVLEWLPTGTVRAKGVPRFVAMGVSYDESLESEPPLVVADLEVSDLVTPTLDKVIEANDLVKATPAATLAAIEAFFAREFAYSLSLSDPKDAGKSRTIADFLLRDHKGHCEYFATGTVLLLRRAGIPARYTVGYSAQEYSEREGAFLVRNRHAHAWTSAFIDGRWMTVDTTPSRWAEAEGEAARSIFGPLMDIASWLGEYAVQAWMRHSLMELAGSVVLVLGFLVMAPFALVLGRRWRKRPRRLTGAMGKVAQAWLKVEKGLAAEGHVRDRTETPLEWARRLRRENQFESWRGELVDLARAYYRARFDPAATAATADDFIRSANERVRLHHSRE
jgi:transglutaminase-like putative cysteine protease